MNSKDDDWVSIDIAAYVLRRKGVKVTSEEVSSLLEHGTFRDSIKTMKGWGNEKYIPRSQVDIIYQYLLNRRRQRRIEALQLLGCWSIFISICWILILWAKGNTPIIIFANIVLGYLIDAVIAFFTIGFMIAIFATPVGIRNIIAILTSIGFSILLLDRLNSRFGWGWNFPDIYSVVTATLTMTYFLTDRYLSKKKAG